MFVYSDSKIQGSCLTHDGVLTHLEQNHLPPEKMLRARTAMLHMLPGDYLKVAGSVIVCVNTGSRLNSWIIA